MIAELEKPQQRPVRRPSYRLDAAVAAAIMGAIALIAATSYTAGRDVVWIDPVTGSMKKETQWLGQTTATVIEPSAIEKWINSRGNPHLSNWKNLHATLKNLQGQTIGCSCANAPAIYPLRAGSLDEAFVRNATGDEINDFIRIMRSGTEDEKQQAVTAALDDAQNPR